MISTQFAWHRLWIFSKAFKSSKFKCSREEGKKWFRYTELCLVSDCECKEFGVPITVHVGFYVKPYQNFLPSVLWLSELYENTVTERLTRMEQKGSLKQRVRNSLLNKRVNNLSHERWNIFKKLKEVHSLFFPSSLDYHDLDDSEHTETTTLNHTHSL